MSQSFPYPPKRHEIDLLLRANTNDEHNIVRFRIKLPDENKYIELIIDGLTHQAPGELMINMIQLPDGIR